MLWCNTISSAISTYPRQLNQFILGSLFTEPTAVLQQKGYNLSNQKLKKKQEHCITVGKKWGELLPKQNVKEMKTIKQCSPTGGNMFVNDGWTEARSRRIKMIIASGTFYIINPF